MTETNTERAVVICTKDRGVFFGYVTGAVGRSKVKLRAGRNCIYWPAECRGVVGLAAKGPLQGSKVGPAADMELFGITAVLDCSDDATALWEAEPWA